MRAARAQTLVFALGALGVLGVLAAPAAAEPLPPGSIGAVFGAASGTGVDANRLGFGYQIGGQAAWQPMSTKNRLGWAVKWSAAFGTMYDAGAASVGDTLRTLHMDLMLGVRIRPGVDRSRYLTLRAGGQILRTDQKVPMKRGFSGGVASVGLDQYAYGFLFNFDVRVNQIGFGGGPTIIALMLGASKTGP